MSRSPDSRINQQSGSALVPLLLFFVVLVPMLSLFLGRWSELLDSKNLRAICRSELAEGQKVAGQNIQNLLNLNPLVKAAKAEMIAAKAALAAATTAMNAPAMEAALLWIKNVKTRQNALRLQQKFFLFQISYATKTASVRTSHMIMREEAKGMHDRKIENLRIRAARSSVRPISRSDTYPEYELEQNFEQRQKVELIWQSHFSKKRSEKAWTLRKIMVPESCGMSLRQDTTGLQRQFIPLPLQDKYFWKR